MTFSQFTSIKQLKHQLGLEIEKQVLFPNIQLVVPSNWLKETFSITLPKEIAFFSEKSRSEAIVFPVLTDIQRQNNYVFALYSGGVIEADKEKGLAGECDFILSKGLQSSEVEFPFFCLVEAKDNDIDIGVPQCAAQMKGAQILNEKEGKPLDTIYGCSTTGEIWKFLKLTGNTLTIDENRYHLDNVAEILGVLQAIINLYAKQ